MKFISLKASDETHDKFKALAKSKRVPYARLGAAILEQWMKNPSHVTLTVSRTVMERVEKTEEVSFP